MQAKDRKRGSWLNQDERWYGPCVELEIKGFSELGIYGRGMHRAYRLDLPTQQKLLLDTFILIDSQESAYEWCKQFGLPAYQISRPSSDLTEPKDGFRMPAYLIKRASSEPAERREELLYSTKIRFEEDALKIVQAARCLNALVRLHRDYVKAVKSLNVTGLEKFIREVGTSKFVLNPHLTYLIPGEEGAYYDTPKAYISKKNSLLSVNLEEIIFENVNNISKELLFQAARKSLTDAANIMVNAIPTKFSWSEGADGFDTRVTQELLISCPWHAITSHFVSLLKGHLEEVCPHPNCQEPLTGRSAGTKSCKSAKCRKWVQRHRDKFS